MSRVFCLTRLNAALQTFARIALLTIPGASVTAQTPADADVRPLGEGPGVERELKGDQAHSYSVSLRSGQFLSVVVQQKGIDVVVALFDPANRKMAEVDSPNGVEGPEPLSSISEMDGSYRLEVRSLDKDAAVGHYAAKIVELRPATADDKTRIAAQSSFAEGVGLQAQQSVEGFRAATKKYEKAANLYKTVGDKEGEALALQSSGVLHRELGENQLALDVFNQVLPLRRASGNKVGEADALIGIGFVYLNLGELGLALKFYNEALPLTQAAGDTIMEATALNNLGTVYSYLGESEKALKSYATALPLFRSMGDKRAEATMLGNIGKVYADLGKRVEALDFYSQALPLHRAVGDPTGEAFTLNNMGVSYRDLGEKEKALKHYTEALEIRRIVGDRSGEAGTLNNMAVVYADLGQQQKALDIYGDCVPLLRAIGDKRSEALTLDNLLDGWEHAGNRRFGVFFGKLSVGVYQVIRSNVNPLDKNTQQTFLRFVESPYRRLVGSLIEDNRYAEAQELLNAFKDQQVFDPDRAVIASSLTLTPKETSMSEAFDQQVEKVAAAVRALESFKVETSGVEPTAETKSQLKNLETRLQLASDDYHEFLRMAARTFAALDVSERGLSTTGSLRSLQSELRKPSTNAEREAVAVYQLVGVTKFHSLIVTPSATKAVTTPIKSNILNQEAKTLWALLQSDKYDPRAAGKELYDIVFKPIEKELPPGTKTILWSLDGNLRYVPMAALFDGKQYLVERYNNVTFTRVDGGRLTRDVSPKWTAEAFGSSKAHSVEVLGNRTAFGALPGVRAELETLFGKINRRGVLSGEVLMDDAFTRENMLARLQTKRPVVHIASHFSFRPGDESRSFLLMGDGSAFTLADMKNQKDMFAGVELLTLSACNTAAQQADANGREVDAFFELAQRLGAQSVMATLWPVADNSTPWLMREFYDLKVNKKQNKAEALRNAQLALLNGSAKAARSRTRADASQVKVIVAADAKGKTETRADYFVIEKKDAKPYIVDPKRPFAHPFYWSPFVLIGNWR